MGGGDARPDDADAGDGESEYEDREPETVQTTLDDCRTNGGVGGKAVVFAEIGNLNAGDDAGGGGGDSKGSDDGDSDDDSDTGTLQAFSTDATQMFLGMLAITAARGAKQDIDEEAVKLVSQALYERAKEELRQWG